MRQQHPGSMRAAIRGLAYVAATQGNFRIHLLSTILVLGAAWIMEVSRMEWAVLLIVIALVLAMETMNTALELLADHVQPEHDPLIGKAKDVAAGAVLITAVFAFVTGMLIFGKYVF